MPAPATVAELLDLVQKSGVAEESRLKTYLDKLKQQGMPAEPAKVAGLMVRDGVLTYFQAEQLLQGKYKRFSLGKYKVLEKLGSGGMGTVFLCEHKLMRRRVAVKVLPTAKAADDASRERFYREARAIAAVDHPNIVRAYDIDQDENLHFLVMEYVDGTNLQDLVKKFGPLDVVRACHYIYGAAVGLQHAHEIGLVHRDIKPGNILLDRSGVVKILDMGLARLTHDSEDNLTKQYDENILGTADYLSPEQAEDSHTVDIRSDIYSLGATFYFLLTGHAPFPEGTIPQKLIWHRSREPKSVREIRPDVAPEVVLVLTKMMAKKPEDRYQTPSEVMAALTPWASTPIAPPTDKEMPQLSPAISGLVGGMRPTTSGPRSMTSPVQNGQAGMPTLVATGMTPSPTRGDQSSASNVVWETLSDVPVSDLPEPDSLSTSSTPSPAPKSTRVRMPRIEKQKKSFLLPIVAISVLLLGGAAAGAYFIFFNKTTIEPTTPGAERTRRIVVSKTPGGTDPVVGTLREALIKAQSGDTIVVNEPVITEGSLRLPPRAKDITIESGGAKPSVIEFTGHGGNGAFMLQVPNGADGCRFKNLELDCKNAADFGIDVTGIAPGVTLENVTVRNAKTAPFRLFMAAGQPGRPVTLGHCRAVLSPSSEAGILLAVQPGVATDLKHIAIRNSRFEGPGKAGISVDGSAQDIEISNNRFFQVDAALLFTRVPEGRNFKAQVHQNTVLEAKVGLQIPGPGGKMDVAVNRNYFAKVQAIVDAPGVPGVTSQDNAQRESGPGNGPVTAQPVEAQLPPPNPNDDATFLRFPAGAAPAINGNRVGAN